MAFLITHGSQALPHVIEAMRNGYRCWSELHPYFKDHSQGSWREWLCSR